VLRHPTQANSRLEWGTKRWLLVERIANEMLGAPFKPGFGLTGILALNPAPSISNQGRDSSDVDREVYR
jgi:hypothetical protein